MGSIYTIIFSTVVLVCGMSFAHAKSEDHKAHGNDHKHDHKHDHKGAADKLNTAPLAPAGSGAYRATVTVNGMVCSFCAQGIEKKFKARKEVDSLLVDLDHKQVLVNFKPGQAMSDKDIKEIITGAGFAVTDIKVEPGK